MSEVDVWLLPIEMTRNGEPFRITKPADVGKLLFRLFECGEEMQKRYEGIIFPTWKIEEETGGWRGKG